MPRNPVEYGNLLRDLIDRHEVDCWLVNTGWTGGPFGVGRRMPIQWTRTLLEAVLRGSLKEGPFRTDNYFGFQVPVAVDGVPRHTLEPYKTWQDKEAFHSQANRLLDMFLANFKKFEPMVDADVLRGSPKSTIAAG
jgi:phosphoenolpyruvate carboxykinase (ATP)